MNQNYIAPEALDDDVRGTCLGCKRISATFDEKVSFYQGQCPHCGNNPSLLVAKKSETMWEMPRQPSRVVLTRNWSNEFVYTSAPPRATVSFEELPGTLEPTNEEPNTNPTGIN